MNSKYVHWDDLDLDYFLGESNWTDGKDELIWGRESEWGSDGNGAGEDDSVTAMASVVVKKENIKGSTKRTSKPSNYQCPLCDTCYKSPSGFRGHVLKKHGRSDLKGM